MKDNIAKVNHYQVCYVFHHSFVFKRRLRLKKEKVIGFITVLLLIIVKYCLCFITVLFLKDVFILSVFHHSFVFKRRLRLKKEKVIDFDSKPDYIDDIGRSYL